MSTHPIKNPHDEMWWGEHLDWMLENYPEKVLEMFREKTLKAYLDEKVARALTRWGELVHKGKPVEQASEVIQASLISPSDGPALSDNPPNPLPQVQLRRINKWAGGKFPDVTIEVPTTA